MTNNTRRLSIATPFGKSTNISASTPAYYDRFSVGLDEFFNGLQNLSLQKDNYPPHNIVKHNEDEYSISVAVAGFKPDEVSVTKDQNVLTIEGSIKQEEFPGEEPKVEYLYRGLSNRDFYREFRLAEYVDVQSAKIDNGILTVRLKREIPDSAKPTKIDISF